MNNNIPGLKINETDFKSPNGKIGKIAVLLYTGSGEPSKILDFAVQQYVGTKPYYELIDAHLDNPWMRVIISDHLNELSQEDFDITRHKLEA